MNTRTQYRAICPACFKQHAINGNSMVDHGYTIPHDWHQRKGSCGGVGEAHFGTPEGLEVTKSIRVSFEKYLGEQREHLVKLNSGKVVKIDGRKSHDHKAPLEQLTPADGHWFTDTVKRAIYQTEANIRGVTGDINMLGTLIKEWKPVEPVAVEIETGPTIHMHSERSRAGVLCVWSNNSRRGYVSRHSTKNESEVTCAACLKQLAAVKAEAETKAKAETLVEAMVVKHGAAVRERFSQAAELALREIRYKMPAEDKKVKQAACRIIER